MTRIVVALLTAIGLFSRAAEAQSPGDVPAVMVGVGVAAMQPVHGDDYTEGRAVLGTVSVRTSAHTRVDLNVTRRAASRSFVSDDVFLYGGPTGIDGHADRTVSGTETTDWTTGLSLLGQTRGRVVRLVGGAGVLFHRERQRDYRIVTNCTPPIPSSGFECGEFDRITSESGVGFEMQAGVDVSLSRRLVVYGGARYELRGDVAMGTFGFGGGVRIVLR